MLPYERLRFLTAALDRDPDALEAVVECLTEFAAEPAQLVLVCRRLLAHHPDDGALWWWCARLVASGDPAAAVTPARRALARDRTVTRLVSALPFPHDDPIAVLGWSPTVADALAQRPDLDVVAVRLPGDPHPPADGCRVVDRTEVMALAPSHALVGARLAGPDVAAIPRGATATLGEIPAAVPWLVAPLDRLLPARLAEAARAAFDADRPDDDAPGDVRVPGAGRPASAEWSALTAFARVAGPGGVEDPMRLASRIDCPVAPELRGR